MDTFFADVIRVARVTSQKSADLHRIARASGLDAGFGISQRPHNIRGHAWVYWVYKLRADVDRKVGENFKTEQAYEPVIVGSDAYAIFTAEADKPSFLVGYDRTWDQEIVGFEGRQGEHLSVKLTGPTGNIA